jgi:hypothetical protein
MSKDLDLALPPMVADRAASLGSAGHAWLTSLPALVNRLCMKWTLVPDSEDWLAWHQGHGCRGKDIYLG